MKQPRKVILPKLKLDTCPGCKSKAGQQHKLNCDEIREGEFENGVLVSGKHTTYNTICEGTFRDGKLHGRGVRTYTDKGGRKPPQVGFFNDGKFTGDKDQTGGWPAGGGPGGAAGGGPGGAAGGKDLKTHADLLADSVCMLHARICALERKWEI